MIKIKVYKKGNYSQLRLLFPQLRIAEEYPVYSKFIFSTFDYDVPDNVELFLLNDKTGIPLDTQGGLCVFLRQVSYMQDTKIARLAAVKSFGEKELVYNMYHEAISLKVSGRSYLEDEEVQERVTDVIRKPLYERLYALSLAGGDFFLRTLKYLNKYYAKDASMNVSQYKDVSDALLGWNTPQLKSLELTGDNELDMYQFFASFPNRRK